MAELIKVATFNMLHEAQIAVGRLEAEGIPAIMTDAYLTQAIPGTIIHIKVLVGPEHESAAKRILATDYTSELDDDDETP